MMGAFFAELKNRRLKAGDHEREILNYFHFFAFVLQNIKENTQAFTGNRFEMNK